MFVFGGNQASKNNKWQFVIVSPPPSTVLTLGTFEVLTRQRRRSGLNLTPLSFAKELGRTATLLAGTPTCLAFAIGGERHSPGDDPANDNKTKSSDCW
jgi:hypothetical protein